MEVPREFGKSALAPCASSFRYGSARLLHHRLKIRDNETREQLPRGGEHRVHDDTFTGAEAAHDEGVELLVGKDDRRVKGRAGVVMAACSSSSGQSVDAPVSTPSTPSSSPSPSPAASVEDFHTDWCLVMQPYTRVVDDLPTLARDADIVRTVRRTVDGLDALTLRLEEAGHDTASLLLEDLANAIDDQAEVLDSRAGEISAATLIDTLRDQSRSIKAVTRAIIPAVDEMGRC